MENSVAAVEKTGLCENRQSGDYSNLISHSGVKLKA